MVFPTRNSIAASSQGPAKFHTTMARFKRTMPAPGAVAAPKTSFSETTDETSSDKISSGGSIREPVVEETSNATCPQVANNDVATMERRHDSVLNPTTEQAATSSYIGTLTPRPPRKNLRASLRALQVPRQQSGAPCTGADNTPLDVEDEDDKERLAIMKKRVYDGHALLDVRQQELDEFAAKLDEEDAALEAQELADAKERAWEAQIRAAREQREAAAGRLAQRIVAEVVPMSASGRAYSDVAEIRRCAAPKVEYQMVPDGNYPRFHPSSKKG